jgi:hypothetical protein
MTHPSWLARLGLYSVALLVGLRLLAGLIDTILSDGRAFFGFVIVSVVCHFIVHRARKQPRPSGALERTPHDPSPRADRHST